MRKIILVCDKCFPKDQPVEEGSIGIGSIHNCQICNCKINCAKEPYHFIKLFDIKVHSMEPDFSNKQNINCA